MQAPEFLAFAKADLEDNSERGRLNAINNAKRAIACRVDEILTLSGLTGFMARERWGLPYKFEVIRKLGSPAPPVLRGYITSRRNQLEHEYSRPPSEDDIRYVADIAELFLGATKDWVRSGFLKTAKVRLETGEPVVRMERGREKKFTPTLTYEFEFDFESRTISMTSTRMLDYYQFDHRRAYSKSWGELLSEPVTETANVLDCDKVQLTELQRILRERCHR